jgi:hypothetical protein
LENDDKSREAISLTEGQPVHYEVPLGRYFTVLDVKADREGYETLKVYIQRNIVRAVCFGDMENARKFLGDWANAIQMFGDVLSKEEKERERARLEAFPAEAFRRGAVIVERGVSTVMKGVNQFFEGGGFFKAILAGLGVAAGGYALHYAATKRKVIGP